MTFRFNYNQFTANDAGRKLVCVSATSDYFTVGKTYIIKMDGNSPCLITDDGQHLHATGSEFEFYHGQNLTPKQPKAGEVWSRRRTFTTCSLYVVASVVDGRVYTHHINGNARFCDPVEQFLRDNTFVF
ncbi:hypothetical protein [Vibrio phage VpV262]|uniref:Uncharacterized protein n=1 Tax=Vibrio phage VpV262 TaxID=2907796 RepID=Q8LT80_9CAUD|nr:hypothetical protein VpV262p22 [Vibrio phage VpV262]AAM28370.1 hypothetical protein [Vibrio phage VpV262]